MIDFTVSRRSVRQFLTHRFQMASKMADRSTIKHKSRHHRDRDHDYSPRDVCYDGYDDDRYYGRDYRDYGRYQEMYRSRSRL